MRSEIDPSPKEVIVLVIIKPVVNNPICSPKLAPSDSANNGRYGKNIPKPNVIFATASDKEIIGQE